MLYCKSAQHYSPFIFLSFPPPFLSPSHSDPSRCSRPFHLGRPPILFGTGHGVILHVHGSGRGSISSVIPLVPGSVWTFSPVNERSGVLSRTGLLASHMFASGEYAHIGVHVGGERARADPLSLPRPRPASPVPADPSSCRTSQKRAITRRQHNTLAASRRCLPPPPLVCRCNVFSDPPTSQSCTHTHPLVLGCSRHVWFDCWDVTAAHVG